MSCSAAPTSLAGSPYYESVDMVDAYHPQTIVAHALNGEPLPVANGAPLRVRIERQLGYKSAKYLTGDRSGGEPRRDRRRQGRILGGPFRLPLVRGRLTGASHGPAPIKHAPDRKGGFAARD